MNMYPFPQANSIEKILKLVNIDNEGHLKDPKYLKVFLDVEPRQVQYYRSACQFLGILDKDYKFTKDGYYLRSLIGTSQKIELAYIVFSNSDFLYAYVNNMDTWEEFSKLIRNKYNYSEGMYKRRSESALAWIDYFELETLKNEDNFNKLQDNDVLYLFLSQKIYGFELENEYIEKVINRFDSNKTIDELRMLVNCIK